jgi:hypothetical protein
MKFCPVVPEICRGHFHVPKKERKIIIIRRRNGDKKSPAHNFSSHTISPQQKICLLSSVAILVYNQSAISVNRQDVSFQFLSSFSRLFVQEYETDCCLRNRTDKNTNNMNCELMLTYDTPALQQTGNRNLTGQKTLPMTWGTYMKLVTKYQISAINSC